MIAAHDVYASDAKAHSLCGFDGSFVLVVSKLDRGAFGATMKVAAEFVVERFALVAGNNLCHQLRRRECRRRRIL